MPTCPHFPFSDPTAAQAQYTYDAYVASTAVFLMMLMFKVLYFDFDQNHKVGTYNLAVDAMRGLDRQPLALTRAGPTASVHRVQACHQRRA